MGMEMGRGLRPNWASGIFLLQAVEQQGSSLQTKSSLGRKTGSSHSHSRLNTLKTFLVAANSKLNCNRTAVFPPLQLARQTPTARSGLSGCFPPSSPPAMKAAAQPPRLAQHRLVSLAVLSSPGTTAPRLVPAQQKHILCCKDCCKVSDETVCCLLLLSPRNNSLQAEGTVPGSTAPLQ